MYGKLLGILMSPKSEKEHWKKAEEETTLALIVTGKQLTLVS